jgi:hypothetical protein
MNIHGGLAPVSKVESAEHFKKELTHERGNGEIIEGKDGGRETARERYRSIIEAQDSPQVRAAWDWVRNRRSYETARKSGEVKLSRSDQARIQGLEALGKSGVAISQMTQLKSTLFSGQHFDNNTSALVVRDHQYLLPVWAFCS